MKAKPNKPSMQLPIHPDQLKQWRTLIDEMRNNNINLTVVGKYLIGKLLEAQTNNFKEVKKFI